MKRIISYTMFTLMGIGLFFTTGCQEDFLVENPPHIISAETLYQSVDGFEAGLNGLYSLFREERAGDQRGSSNNPKFSISMVGTDNIYGNWRSGPARTMNELGTRSNPGYSHYRRVFTWLYETINSANTLINRAETADLAWSEDEKNGIMAQARCIRAWAYRHLTYMWGDVPLNLTEAGEVIRTDWERTPIGEVRAQMEEDWLFAVEHLPDVPAIEGRLSKVVAQHYLAELYLAIGEPGQARDMAQAVVDNSNYSLITERYGVEADQPGTPFTDMFIDGNSNRSQGNTEVLWTIQLEAEVNGGEGNNVMRRWNVNRYWALERDDKNPIEITAENGGRGLGRHGPTRYALDVYEPGDDRGGEYAWRYYWIVNHSNPDQIPEGLALGDTIFLNWESQPNEPDREADWPNTRKWDSPNPLDPTASRQYDDQVYLRLAETILLLAEAQFELGDAAGAAQSINLLRERANAMPITAADVNIDFILDERSRELFCEEHRRYTLIRLNKWVERTQLYNSRTGPEIDPQRDRLLPIPQNVIDANTTAEMRQNPGY